MLDAAFDWAGSNVAKIAILWFIILAAVFLVAYPLYYVVIAVVLLGGLPLHIRDRDLRWQAIGFFVALAASCFLFVYLIGPVRWWEWL